MYPLSRDAHSHTHLSGVLSYASPSILSMPLHADLAAAIALNHNVGTKFTLTVTAGGIAVKHAPFGGKGKEAKWQLNKTFWEVRTPYGHRRTLFVVAHASETCSTKHNVVCGVAEKTRARSHQAYSHRAAARAAQKGHLRDKALDPDRRILSRGCAIGLCRTGNLTAGLLYLWSNRWCDSRASVRTAQTRTVLSKFVAGLTLGVVSFASNRHGCVHWVGWGLCVCVCVCVCVRVCVCVCVCGVTRHHGRLPPFVAVVNSACGRLRCSRFAGRQRPC